MTRFLVVGCIAAGLTAGLAALSGMNPSACVRDALEPKTSLSEDVTPQGIGALGWIEPHTEVRRIDAPSTLEPSLVQELLVREGESVGAGQTLAVLDSRPREQADVNQAQAALTLAEKSLARVLAGARQGEIQAQAALVERSRARLQLMEKQAERVQRLTRNHASTVDELDIRLAEQEMQRHDLQQQTATLQALKEVRDVDVQYAEAEVARARAALQRAEADLELTMVRSPIAGRILRIHTQPGERIGTDGLLELGDTQLMDVVAEIHESDIPRVRLGQTAEARLRNQEQQLHGQVVQIGKLVGRRDVLSTDPIDDTDARVVEVRIRLDAASGQQVEHMSFARVDVLINLTHRQE